MTSSQLHAGLKSEIQKNCKVSCAHIDSPVSRFFAAEALRHGELGPGTKVMGSVSLNVLALYVRSTLSDASTDHVKVEISLIQYPPASLS